MIAAEENTALTSDLAKYLEHWLVLPECRGRLFCHVLTDTYTLDDWAREPIGPRRTAREYLCAKHMVFVFMQSAAKGVGSASESPKRKHHGADTAIVLGITAHEYASCRHPTRRTRAYVQYVDTTGAFQPRRLQGVLTRAVVAAYIRFCRDVLGVDAIHIFASAKPALLFAGSESLPRKRVLGSRALIAWWCALLHGCLADCPVSCTLYSPQEECLPRSAQFARLTAENLASLCDVHVSWQYGMPWPADAPVAEHVPLFEDDPKWKHYDVLTGDGEGGRHRKRMRRSEQDFVSVGEFFQTMSYRWEFRQEHSAFITVRFHAEPDASLLCMAACAKRAREEAVPAPVWKSAMVTFGDKVLKTLSFATETDVLKSTVKLNSWLRIMGASPFEIRMDCEGCFVDNGFGRLFQALCAKLDEGPIAMVLSSPPISDVQGLIRRKVPRNLLE